MANKKVYNDITLTCKTCGKEFLYSVTEQRFFEDKGFGAPIRCHDCRNAKKARNIEREEKKAAREKAKAEAIDPNEDWVGAMLQRWEEQKVIFGDKEI